MLDLALNTLNCPHCVSQCCWFFCFYFRAVIK